MVLGALIILITGFYVLRYFRNLETEGLLPENGQNQDSGSEEAAEGDYVTVEGDTLWSIAESQYGDGFVWQAIAEANEISNPSEIEVGQSLVLPEIANREPVSAQPQMNDVAGNAISGATYEVQKGDTLWSIAVRAYGDGYRWIDVARENNLDQPNIIHAGNVLTLPR